MAAPSDFEVDDIHPRRRGARRKRGWGVFPWIGLTLGIIGLVVLVLLVVRDPSIITKRGGTSPTDVVERLIQATKREDWNGAFNLFDEETKVRVAEGARGYLRTVPNGRPNRSDRAIFLHMSQYGPYWPMDVGPASKIISERTDGDSAVVTVQTNEKTAEVLCVKHKDRWYITDR